MRAPQQCLPVGLVLLMGLHGACDESATLGNIGQPADLPAAEAIVELSAEDLNFGMVCVEAEATLTFTLENSGTAATDEITGRVTEESSSDFTSPDLSIPSLEPGESYEVEVFYAPTGDDSDVGTWQMTHGDQSWEVELVGQEGGPEVQVDPVDPDFGTVPVGVMVDIPFVFKSTGETGLSIGQVDILPTEDPGANPDVPDWFHWVLPPSFPQFLEPTESLTMVLRLAPEAYTAPQETPQIFLGVQSTDCLETTTLVPVLGWPGGTDELCPADPTVTDVLYGKDAEPTDVLFVVDNSQSMEEEQTQLADNFGVFVDSASALGVDYRIGVTTTESTGELMGMTPIVTSENANDFLSNVLVGTDGGNTETGLDSGLQAINPISGEFYPHMRPEAILVVIFVSDEPDKSQGPALDYLTVYQAAKTTPDRFFAHAIVGPLPEYGCPTADYGPRYAEVAEASGGVVASICEPSFADALVAFGEASFAAKTRFDLSELAVPGTVSITVNGSSCDTDWLLDDSGEFVRFDPESSCLPNSGDEVIITYEMVCLEEETP
ncbi:MAG: choice-of-anchor D domain-containing protein [Myxococcota bacterium]|nr:choice-of-anchor D domain-containing protein [Myxococcota bacterium]